MKPEDYSIAGKQEASGFGRLRPTFQWLALAAISFLIAAPMEVAGFSAALLMGPMLAGVSVSLCGATIRLPKSFFFVVQIVLAMMIAGTISPTFVGNFSANWPLFLAIVMSVIALSSFSGWIITRMKILPGTTAVWGTSAGAASTMLIMATAYGADARLVAFMQYLRVLFVAGVATLVAQIGGHNGAPLHALNWFAPVDLPSFAATLGVGTACAFVGTWLRIPAGAFLLPFAVGSAMSLTGVLKIELPQLLLAASYALLGWSIGLGFTRAILLHARRALLPTVLSIVALIGFSGLLAALLVLLLDIDPLTAYLATSPGGLDSIAVIAASSNVDIAFIMALQTSRLILVTFIGPALARFVADKV